MAVLTAAGTEELPRHRESSTLLADSSCAALSPLELLRSLIMVQSNTLEPCEISFSLRAICFFDCVFLSIYPSINRASVNDQGPERML